MIETHVFSPQDEGVSGSRRRLSKLLL